MLGIRFQYAPFHGRQAGRPDTGQRARDTPGAPNTVGPGTVFTVGVRDQPMTDDDPGPDEAHLRALEGMYHEAPCNDRLDPTLSIGTAEATVEFAVDGSTHHAAGGMHGSYYFKALDDAAFFAVNSLVEDVFVLTTGFDVHFERPVSEGLVRAEGVVVNANPNQLLASAIAEDGEGNEIARGTGRFARSRVALDEEVGYERE